MTQPPSYDEIFATAQRFRQAVADGNYDQAHALLDCQQKQLQSLHNSPEFSQPESTVLFEKLIESFEWCRVVVTATRADAATELKQVQNFASYRAASPTQRQTWQLTA